MFYALSKLAAAKEIARSPQSDPYIICRKYAIFPSRMTQDEITEFNQMIEDFEKGSI